MDCHNKNCKFYRKKEKAHYFMGVDLSGSGYCSKDIAKSNFARKESSRNSNMIEIIIGIFDIAVLITKIAMFIYAGWKFLSGDKKKIETLWYGILFVALMT